MAAMRCYENLMTTTKQQIWQNKINRVYCCCCRCILHLQQYSRRLNLFFPPELGTKGIRSHPGSRETYSWYQKDLESFSTQKLAIILITVGLQSTSTQEIFCCAYLKCDMKESWAFLMPRVFLIFVLENNFEVTLVPDCFFPCMFLRTLVTSKEFHWTEI